MENNKSDIKTIRENVELKQIRQEEVKEATYSISELKNTFLSIEMEQEAYRNSLRNEIEDIAKNSGIQSDRSNLINLMGNRLSAGYEKSKEYIARIDDILIKVRALAPDDLAFRRELMRAQDKAAEFCEQLKSLLPDKKQIAKSVLTAPLKVAKGAANKANPFDKPINMNDTSDSGVESIRLAYTSAKKGYNTIKTADSTIKTTVRTVKTTKDVVKGTGTVIYNTARYTGKAVVVTYKVTEAIVTHIIAALSNPVVLIALAFLILVVYLSGAITTIISSVAAITSARKQQLSMSTGFGDENAVSEQYQQGQTYFNNAIQSQRDGYNALIDNLYYDPDINVENDLVRVDRYKSNEYDSSWQHSTDDLSPDEYENLGVFAFPAWKDTLKNDVWDIQVSYKEAAAIAYVYLEKQSGGGIVDGIHQVEFTEDVFNTIAAHIVRYEETVTSDQYCPGRRCMRNDASGDVYCDGKHGFHMINIYFNDRNTIMDELGFTDMEKQWVQMTYQGFDYNSGISGRTGGED